MKKAFLSLLIFVSPLAFAAGPFFEPLVTVERTTTKFDAIVTPSTPLASEYDNQGVNLGGTFGWSFDWIAIGGEYLTSALNQKKKPTGEISRLDTSDLGVNLQVMPLEWLKVSGSYFFSSDADDGYTKKFRGTGSRVGIGFRVLPWLSINVDMLNFKYTRAETTGFSFESFSLDRKGYMVGLSFPIGL